MQLKMKIPFDTLVYYKKLRDAGIPKEEADAMTEALRDALMDFYGRIASEYWNGHVGSIG